MQISLIITVINMIVLVNQLMATKFTAVDRVSSVVIGSSSKWGHLALEF